MYALRERRVHVTQEDFELAVAKVNIWISGVILFNKFVVGYAKRFGEERFIKKTMEVIRLPFIFKFISFWTFFSVCYYFKKTK
jgi:hypothetical protein